ncbi:proteophosphoglycan 5 [Streptomyces sp. NPDC006475]|uniref:proteophosphoglycan 5 n=1 Tax=Streptomyces sp. NPDC006475 TaxID=3155719 RepID=UPI0033B981A5
MALITLDIPTPAQLRPRWAALAAVLAARGWGDGCRADDARWHYDDGGGNWLDLHHFEDGRALLVGHDHEYTNTYYGPAAEYFQQQETDLLAGAPAWWEPPLRAVQEAGQWVGFVYGYEDGRWQCAQYEPDDGFASVGLPALSPEMTVEFVTEYTKDSPGIQAPPPTAAIEALVAADCLVTEHLLTAVIGPQPATPTAWNPSAGVAAARAFRAWPRHRQ